MTYHPVSPGRLLLFLQNTQETSVLQNSLETIHLTQLSYFIKREAGDLPK